MKIAYKHLINHIESKPSVEDISKKLFQLGHEHECENNIFDIEFTPNRGDCLSVNGLLRDLSVFYEVKFGNKKYEKEIDLFNLDFTNNAKDHCNNISFLKIEVDGNFKEYKGGLKEYFQLLDANKKNFFTDISNYVAYETGQPTHCYDSKKIKDSINLEESIIDCDFETLLDKEIRLSGSSLIFSSNNKIINLAGIVGGKETSCNANTNSVIVECAYFNPESIIGKSIKYGIQSDAAYKFERGVDPYSHEAVLRRFIYIVNEYTNIKSLELYSKSYKEECKKIIKYDLNKINKILGIGVTQDVFESSLNKLGFKFIKNAIEVPSHRHDICSQNDLAEEIARCIGYNNIEPKSFSVKKINFEEFNENIKKEKIFKRLLIDNGFYEVINFPFSKEADSAIRIDNPIDSNKAHLRENIIESLLENLLFNERRQQDSVKFFESSDIYKANEDGTYQKQKKISIIGSGRVGRNYNDFSKKIDKNYIRSIMAEYINDFDNAIKEIPRSNITTKIKSKIIYLEINLSELNENILSYNAKSRPPSGFNKYSPISDYPKTYRDLSFSLSEYENMNKLNDLVINFQNKYLKEVFIFDYYENLKTNVLKVGYRLIFQANEKTLTDSDVNKIIKTLIDESIAIGGVEIPGIET